MNSLFKLTRIVLALVFALGAVGFSASAALAAPPYIFDVSDSGSFTDATTCTFPINVAYDLSGQQILFFDNDGALTSIHLTAVERDTYTANGVSLTNDPIHFEIIAEFDSNGQVISDWANGIAQRIPLPDGGILYISAGRINFLLHEEGFSLSADIGNPGDLEAFCAAFG